MPADSELLSLAQSVLARHAASRDSVWDKRGTKPSILSQAPLARGTSQSFAKYSNISRVPLSQAPRDGTLGQVEKSGTALGTRAAQPETTEASIVKWLNDHPAPSEPERCAWCYKPHSPSAVVIPFGNEPEGHTWLHVECWPAWHQARRAKAAEALRATPSHACPQKTETSSEA